MYPFGIIGWTGLIGQTLFHQLVTAKLATPAEIACYNSKNVTEAQGQSFDTLFIACMPATKWAANKDPAADKATLDTVLDILNTLSANHVVLLSTVDVMGVAGMTHAYGIHRRYLEDYCRARWCNTAHIVRLPALFGRGLKKNALFDLLHDNQVPNISLASSFQWYNLQHLLTDCWNCVANGITLLEPFSEPITMREIVSRWFPERVWDCVGGVEVSYNFEPYWRPKDGLLAEMDAWIQWEKWRLKHTICASNIGFDIAANPNIIPCLQHAGITALEIAPTRGSHFGPWIPRSMQSLLYGTHIKNIFAEQSAFLHHIDKLMAAAALRGVGTMVFGSPRQRSRSHSRSRVTEQEAIALFQRVGDLGATHNITMTIEPNATGYGATWLTTIDTTLQFVKAVAHPNIRLALDTGNYVMEEDTFTIASIPIEWVGHLQISAPFLGQLSSSTHQLQTVAKDMVTHLWTNGYTGAISYEARDQGVGGEYCWSLGMYMSILEDSFHVLMRQQMYGVSTKFLTACERVIQ